MNDNAFEVQAAMNEAKKVDDRNALLTDALAMLAERALKIDNILLDIGSHAPSKKEWRAEVIKALLTSTDPEALRVARLLGGEGE